MKKINFINLSLVGLPTPKSISFLWNIGFLLGMTLRLQLITGIFLSINYLSSLEEAFWSIIHIIRDVQAGWVIRYLHLNGASIFFILLYLHVWRGMFFNSPKKIPLVWVSGVVILLIAIITAFMGYVLPWGQISYWGATVITRMLSSVPYIGRILIIWLWGDFSVSQPILNRILSLHFILPMVLIVLVVLHLLFLHTTGSSNPLGLNTDFDKLKFLPYFLLKDTVPIFGLIFLFSILICMCPLTLGDPENFTPASLFTTPTHIKPEWYFLFAYAILRCIPSKLGGVLAILFSILVILILVLKKDSLRGKFSIKKKIIVFLFIFLGVLLTWIGGKPVNDVTIFGAQLLTVGYFTTVLFI